MQRQPWLSPDRMEMLAENIVDQSKRGSVEELRKHFGYNKRFDVFLATPFEACDVDDSFRKSHLPFFEAMGDVIEGIGRRPFLPHKEIPEDWSDFKTAHVPLGIVIPESDLVIAYLGKGSLGLGIMLSQAACLNKPLIHVYERGTEIDPQVIRGTALDGGVHSTPTIYHTIRFDSQREAISELRRAVEGFYRDRESV